MLKVASIDHISLLVECLDSRRVDDFNTYIRRVWNTGEKFLAMTVDD